MTTVEEFDRWLRQPEDRDIEFKKAEYTLSKDKDLPDYCAALASKEPRASARGIRSQILTA